MSQVFVPTTGSGSAVTSFTTNTGPGATPAAGVVNIVGGTGITTNGSGNTVTISTTNTVAYTVVTFAMSPYTVLDTDCILSCVTSGGTISIILPNSTSVGRQIYTKDQSGAAATNNVTITAAGGTLIDGKASDLLDQPYESIKYIFGSGVYQEL